MPYNMAALYSTTLFLSASLLFWVQPMIAKMLLPLLGGVPAVWNTCLVFFQAVLLGGYAYAHFVSTRLSIPKQMAAHFCLLALSALALPFGVSEDLIQSLSPAPPAEMVFPNRGSHCGRPLFPVQREQSRQSACLAGLSGLARTSPATAPAKPAVGHWLCRDGSMHSSLWRSGVARRAASS